MMVGCSGIAGDPERVSLANTLILAVATQNRLISATRRRRFSNLLKQSELLEHLTQSSHPLHLVKKMLLIVVGEIELDRESVATNLQAMADHHKQSNFRLVFSNNGIVCG